MLTKYIVMVHLSALLRLLSDGSESAHFLREGVRQSVLESAESKKSGVFSKPVTRSSGASQGANIKSDVEMDSPKSCCVKWFW